MKILYLLTQEMDETGKKILETHRKSQEVTVMDLRQEKDYGLVVDRIAAADKVISW